MSIHEPLPVPDFREPGDFGAARVHGLIGWDISWAERLAGLGKGEWQHALTYVGGGLCLQAEPGGARIVTRPVQSGDIWSSGLAQFALTAAQQGRVMPLAESPAFRDVGYSALDYGAIFCHKLHLPAPGLQDYIGDTGHMICSQMVDEFALKLGLHLFSDGRWAGFVTPWDIGNLLRSAGAIVVP
jgi:hypothetical protein